ncbi:class I SAM-dependent methyltransferase [bacterium]|nr:class I SAM-dependent methyltransferase [bacterium]
MKSGLSDNLWEILRCAYCGNAINKKNDGAECQGCKTFYPSAASGPLDLRLRKSRKYELEFNIDSELLPPGGFNFETLTMNKKPAVDFSNMTVPHHLTAEVLSYFPKAASKGSLMLDLGCGDTVHRDVSNRAGFEYVGLDYFSPDAPILGDAHALPFADNTFDFILSIAVLEHIRYPFVMMREAHRVLKPHGKLIGTVSFLEPFHGDSFYHHTHLGLYNSLQYGGFKIERIAPSKTWSGLRAQANMILFPKLPRILSQAVVLPIEMLHRIWWSAGRLITKKGDEQGRIRSTTGAFTFIASKD